jgi:hypothetical protein
MAYRPLAPYHWKPIEGGGWRLFSPHLRNGAVVQVAAASEFASLDAFRQAILALPLEITMTPKPRVRFLSLRGRHLDVAYDDVPKVNGREADFGAWPLFGGPFLEAQPGSHRLVMKHGNLRRELDFTSLTISDR